MCKSPPAVYIFYDRYRYSAALSTRGLNPETFTMKYLNYYDPRYAEMLSTVDQRSNIKYLQICGLPTDPAPYESVASRPRPSATGRTSSHTTTSRTSRHSSQRQRVTTESLDPFVLLPNVTALGARDGGGRAITRNDNTYLGSDPAAQLLANSPSTAHNPAHTGFTNQSPFLSVDNDNAEVISISSDSPEEQANPRPTHGRPRNAQNRHPGPRRPAADDPVAYSLCAEEPTTMTKAEEDRCLTCRRNGLTCSGTQFVLGSDGKPRCQVCSTKRSDTEDGTGTRRCYWRNAAAGILIFGDAKRAAGLS